MAYKVTETITNPTNAQWFFTIDPLSADQIDNQLEISTGFIDVFYDYQTIEAYAGPIWSMPENGVVNEDVALRYYNTYNHIVITFVFDTEINYNKFLFEKNTHPCVILRKNYWDTNGIISTISAGEEV